MKSLAQQAYEGYCRASDNKSLVTGAELPQWDSLNDEIRRAWAYAASAVSEPLREALVFAAIPLEALHIGTTWELAPAVVKGIAEAVAVIRKNLEVVPPIPSLDDFTHYVFVRQDIPLKHQIVQVAHVLFQAGLAVRFKSSGTPYLIVIGMPDAAALARVETKLNANAITFTKFEDSDYDFGCVTLVTEPLSSERKGALKSYRLWNAANNTGDGQQ